MFSRGNSLLVFGYSDKNIENHQPYHLLFGVLCTLFVISGCLCDWSLLKLLPSIPPADSLPTNKSCVQPVFPILCSRVHQNKSFLNSLTRRNENSLISNDNFSVHKCILTIFYIFTILNSHKETLSTINVNL